MHFFIFIAFTALVGIIAYLATKNTDETSSDGYFLGGRSLSGVVIAGSLLLTNLSTEQLVGLNGQAYDNGILVMAWETLAALTMVVTAVVLLPRYLKGGITTVPQFLEKRYDTMTKTITSGLFLSGYMIVLLPIVLYSGSLALIEIFDIPELLNISKQAALPITVFSIGIVGSIYAIFGGLKAVAVSDTVNAVGLLIGGTLVPVFGLIYIGDGSMMQGIETLVASNPEKMNIIGGPGDPIPFSTLFTGMMLVQLFYWGTNQAIIQRALAAKNLVEGQKGLIYAGFIKILGPIIVVLPGIIAYHIFGDDSKVSGDMSYGMLVAKVLPASLLGFFAAVLFGAILSSFNSALNSSVTLFGLDIYKQHFKKEATEKQVVRAGKTFGIGLALLSMIIAPLIKYAPGGLFDYLQEINGFYSIPILTIIIVGYLTKRIPAIGAKVALFSGSILYLISQFVIKPFLFVNPALEKAKENGITDQIELDFIKNTAYPHFLHVMAILFLLNVLIMLAIGHFKPRETDFELEYTKQVDITPWKLVKPMGLLISVIVILIYYAFS